MVSLPSRLPLTADGGVLGRELGRFLSARRARLQPDDVGLPEGGRRRVPGLRREEVALLAGVSPAYYTRLEQGEGGRVSDEVAVALARALRLTHAETEHLVRLVDPRGQLLRDADAASTIRPALQGLLDTFVDVPAVIVGRRSDILAWNELGSAVFEDLASLPRAERNWARLVFLHAPYRDLFVDWLQKASDVVGQLRMDAGYHPGDARLASLVGELAMTSPTFAQLWAQHDITERCNGVQRIEHPDVGRLELNAESFRVAGEDVSLVTYHAEPGTESHDRLRFLGSWMTEG
ncbi:MAG: helix-turn-helix transcriptional regulator, partial [Mycetocola sp.]